ncbi:hypothetical protein ACFWXK_20255 [Streptomyces sp. NPDC059070]|uniref:hypothetical protein n=1 Tax=Streptomyces sp. NPDC059070 TaxID=3346713 RepID=UPI0036C0DEBD
MGSPDAQAPVPVPAGDPDGPVFVDESGRRGKNLRRLGWLFGLACTCYAVMLVGSLLGGNSRAPWLGIPGPAAKEKTAETVKVTPAPGDSRAARPPASARPAAKPGARAKPRPSGAASHGTKAGTTPKPGKTTRPAKTTPRPRTSPTAKPTGSRSAGPGDPTGNSGTPTNLSSVPTPQSGAST